MKIYRRRENRLLYALIATAVSTFLAVNAAQSTGSFRLATGAMAVAFVVLAVRSWRAGVVLCRSYVEIRNLRGTSRVPIREVSRFEWGVSPVAGSPMPVLVTTTNRMLLAHALAAPNPAVRPAGLRRGRDVVDWMNRDLATFRSASG